MLELTGAPGMFFPKQIFCDRHLLEKYGTSATNVKVTQKAKGERKMFSIPLYTKWFVKAQSKQCCNCCQNWICKPMTTVHTASPWKGYISSSSQHHCPLLPPVLVKFSTWMKNWRFKIWISQQCNMLQSVNWSQTHIFHHITSFPLKVQCFPIDIIEDKCARPAPYAKLGFCYKIYLYSPQTSVQINCKKN